MKSSLHIFRNITIKTKLFIGLILIVLVSGAAGYAASRSTQSVSTSFDAIIDTNVPRTLSLLQLKNSGSEIETNIAEFSVSQGGTSQEGSQASDVKYLLLASLENLQDAQKEYERAADTKRVNETEELKASTEKVVQLASDLASAREQQATALVLLGMQKKVHDAVEELESVADHNIDHELHALNLQDAKADGETARSLRRNITSQLVALAVAIVVGLIMSRIIAKPIAELRKGVNEVSGGNLDKTIPVRAHDEIGQLAEAFNGMSRQLKTSYQELESEKNGIERQVVLRTKQLSEEQARFVASINSLTLGFMMTDAVDHLIYSNPMLWQILGIKPDQSVEGVMGKLDDILGLQERIKACRTSRKVIAINDLTYGPKVLRMFLSPVFDKSEDTVLGVVMLLEDVTEAKVMERSRDEFFSIASHELRTPLTAIRGNASMMQQLYTDGLKNEELNQMVTDIHDSSTRLIEIVNDFLDASRIEQDKMEFKKEKFDILEIVENVIYEMAPVVKERKLYLDCDQTLKSLPEVVADKNRLKQVLYNLTGNALKFTEKGGVKVAATVEGKFMKVRVTDSGRGIPLDTQALLFHKFQQAGESLFTRDTTRGTGLGLYISKLLIEHMGGHLQLEHSEVNKGTTFSFTLPLASYATKESKGKPAETLASLTEPPKPKSAV